MRLADGIRSRDLPMHLHLISAGVSWFSPVALYAEFQKPKGSGDPILQRNDGKKQRHCWAVRSESGLHASSSTSPAPTPGPAPALAGEAASPSFPSPTQAAKDLCAPQSKRLASESVAGSCGNLRLAGAGESRAARARCWASCLPLPAWWVQLRSCRDQHRQGADPVFVLLLPPCQVPLSLPIPPVFLLTTVRALAQQGPSTRLLQATCWQASDSALASCPLALTVPAEGRSGSALSAWHR